MAVSKYYTPTKVFFGRGAENETGKALKEFGAKRVLIHYGSGSVIRSGLLQKVEKLLEENGIEYVELGGAQPNPRLSLVRKGIELGIKEHIDFILAVGGGSALDSAKAIGYGMCYDGDVWDFYSGKTPEKIIPIGTVLTLAATGSEMSHSSVITNDEVTPNRKMGSSSDLGRPALAFLNPELTFTVSPYQTGSGSVDIIMHTLERFFHQGDSLEYTDLNSATLIRCVIDSALAALKNPEDYNARANLMWAGSVSHNNFTAVGSPFSDWACHKIEHELSADYDVAHGAGLASIWGSWARYVAPVNYERFAWLGEKVFGVKEEDAKTAALKTIEEFEKAFSSMGMPIGLHQLGLDIPDDLIPTLASGVTAGDKITVGNFKVLDCKAVTDILREANKR